MRNSSKIILTLSIISLFLSANISKAEVIRLEAKMAVLEEEIATRTKELEQANQTILLLMVHRHKILVYY